MFTVEMLPAAQGDCLWIEYGAEGETPKRILIDGGTVGTIDEIEAKIAAVAAEEGRCRFELVVVTHVDGDHIEGIIKMLGQPTLPVDIDDIWFNGHAHLPDPDGADAEDFMGAKQGDFLSVLLKKRGLPWNNDPWGGKTVYVPPAPKPLPTHTLPGGMQLTLLSPGYDQLKDLAKRWARELEKAGLLGWSDEEKLDKLMESRTLAPDDEFMGRGRGTPPADQIDVSVLQEDDGKGDHSPANGSSIAFLAEYDGASCLLSGDAYSEVLDESLARLLADRGGERLAIDAYKTPHHGSKNNVKTDVLNRIDCHRFLVSSSGSRFKHPDPEAIARLVGGDWRRDPADDEPVTLYFNYRSKFNEPWGDGSLCGEWNYETVFPDEGAEPGLRVDIG